jgi:divalent metal cation (Fe/Co/Zn/Cd) transporter
MSTGGSSPFGAVNIYAVVSLFAAVLFAPVGIALGIVALRQIKRTGERGRELAIAGIWIGVGIATLWLIAIAFTVLMIFLSFNMVSDLSQLPR